MLPRIERAKGCDFIQITDGVNHSNSSIITIEDLYKSMLDLGKYVEVVEEEPQPLVHEVHPVDKRPEMTWKRRKIQKWMEIRHVPFDDNDTKSDLLMKIEAHK